MSFLRILAADSAANSTLQDLVNTAYATFERVINIVMPTVLSVVLLFGIIYGIMLGIQFAKAEDAEAREN